MFSRDGVLWDANRGFLSLFVGSVAVGDLSDVRARFVEPTFEVLIGNLADPVEGVLYRGVLRLGDAAGKVTPLRGVLYSYGEELMLVAEHDVTSVATLRTKLLDLQDELAAREREVAAQRKENERLRKLVEAVMRDRDTLINAVSERSTRRGMS
jgi:hypothetical protein